MKPTVNIEEGLKQNIRLVFKKSVILLLFPGRF